MLPLHLLQTLKLFRIVVINGLVDLYQRGIVDIWKMKCDWNEIGVCHRIMAWIPKELKFDYCQVSLKNMTLSF